MVSVFDSYPPENLGIISWPRVALRVASFSAAARLCTWASRSLGMDEEGAGIFDHHILEREGNNFSLMDCVESRRD